MRARHGYILIECLVALAVLSTSVFVMQRAMRQSISMRGQARDYTQARFLLEELVAEVLLQPELAEGQERGLFGDENSRFSWTRTIEKFEIPAPPLPPDVPPDRPVPPLPVSYLGRITATVQWSRSGASYRETLETLIPPWQLWLPPPPAGEGTP